MRLVTVILLGVSFLGLPSVVRGDDVMMIASPAFKQGEPIPARFTCQGADISPGLQISGVPAQAKSLALIVDDPDASGGEWVHWMVFNVDPQVGVIPEGQAVGTLGWNDFGRLEWGGPCPPRGTHRYFFKLYAIDQVLPLAAGAKKPELLQAMEGHVLAEAELMGVYEQF